MAALGIHLLVDFWGCPSPLLDDLEYIQKHMLLSAEKANATVVNQAFHKFGPQGVSGAVVIAESHITIHTWPERQYAAVDVFTCGDRANPWKAVEYLKTQLRATSTEVTEKDRGLL